MPTSFALAVGASAALLLVSIHRQVWGRSRALTLLPIAAWLLSLQTGYFTSNAPDGNRYLLQVTTVTESGIASYLAGGVANGKELFPIAISPIVWLVGPSLSSIAIANSAFAALALLLLAPTAKELARLSPRARLVLGAVIASPSYWFFSTLPLREGAILLASAIHLNGMKRDAKLWSLMLPLVPLAFLRPILVAAFLGAWLLSKPKWSPQRVWANIRSIGPAALLSCALLLGLPTSRRVIIELSPARIIADRNFNAQLSRSGFPLIDGDGWLALVRSLPSGVARASIRPNPISDLGSPFLAATWGTIAIILGLLLLRSQRSTRNAAVRHAVGFIVCFALLYGATAGDLGQLLRGRLAVLLVMFNSVVWSARYNASSSRSSASGVRGHGLAVVPARNST